MCTIELIFPFIVIKKETITPGSVDTISGKNNRNHNSRFCRYNLR
jgi:hypothetical protein